MFACIFIPDFTVEAVVRAEPMLRGQAVAVLEGAPPLCYVVGLNDAARNLGVQIGMTRMQVEGEREIEASQDTKLGRSTTKTEKRKITTWKMENRAWRTIPATGTVLSIARARGKRWSLRRRTRDRKNSMPLRSA